jgi:hypothetical protein
MRGISRISPSASAGLERSGPETTVWSTFYEVPKGVSRVLIGRPVGNASVYVLGSHLEPRAPRRERRALHRRRRRHARLSQPARADGRALCRILSVPAGMYRTGDIVRFLSDGETSSVSAATTIKSSCAVSASSSARSRFAHPPSVDKAGGGAQKIAPETSASSRTSFITAAATDTALRAREDDSAGVLVPAAFVRSITCRSRRVAK